MEFKEEDLKEYSKHLGISNRKLEDDLCFQGLSFSKHGNIRDCEDDKIVSNRSYWQMYNIIKNLID